MCNGMQIIRLHGEAIREMSVETYVLFPDKTKRTQCKLTEVGEGGGDGAIKMRKTTRNLQFMRNVAVVVDVVVGRALVTECAT